MFTLETGEAVVAVYAVAVVDPPVQVSYEVFRLDAAN